MNRKEFLCVAAMELYLVASRSFLGRDIGNLKGVKVRCFLAALKPLFGGGYEYNFFSNWVVATPEYWQPRR